jgi:hypothetical protein
MANWGDKGAGDGGGELIVNVMDHDDPGPHSLESSTKQNKANRKISWEKNFFILI